MSVRHRSVERRIESKKKKCEGVAGVFFSACADVVVILPYWRTSKSHISVVGLQGPPKRRKKRKKGGVRAHFASLLSLFYSSVCLPVCCFDRSTTCTPLCLSHHSPHPSLLLTPSASTFSLQKVLSTRTPFNNDDTSHAHVLVPLSLNPTTPLTLFSCISLVLVFLISHSLLLATINKMAELDAIYNAYNEITDAGENAPQVLGSKLMVHLVTFAQYFV